MVYVCTYVHKIQIYVFAMYHTIIIREWKIQYLTNETILGITVAVYSLIIMQWYIRT